MKSISELFSRYHISLYNFYYGQSRDDSLSKDLVQNVFERIIKYRARYNEQYPFKPWLFKLAWNEQNDYYRKKRLSLPGDEQLSFMIKPEIEEGNNNLEEQKSRLKKAMTKLSTEQQQLLQLTQFEGLKYAEVAEIMGCTLSAIKVRVHRTMKALRQEYKKYDLA